MASTIEAVRLIRESADLSVILSVIQQIFRDLSCPSQCIELRDYIGRRAAKRGRIDVLEVIAKEGYAHRFGWTVAIRAARAHQFDTLWWLLESRRGLCEFSTEIAAAVAVTGRVDVLEWIYPLGDGKGNLPLFIKGLCAAAVAAPDPIEVLEWIRKRWPDEFQALSGEELTASVLNNRNLLHKCIPVLKWILSSEEDQKHAPRLVLDRITSRLVSACPESVNLFEWLYQVEKETKGGVGALFSRTSVVEGAVVGGNMELLQLVDRQGGASRVLLDPNTSALAARNGQLDVLKWLVQAGNQLSPDVTACAFSSGHLDILKYLYYEVNAPFGCWRGRGDYGTSVDLECWEFYKLYADDWSCGIFPPVNIKPATHK